ncbi:Putative SWIB/MDM2 domain-containing protein [Septoria linicola]|uniref:SWIB/MDM2 domain-containing protein n=1 Tax=Septoria linicola TaxID=215465 RepID=A0A9Q9AZB7_9PEZI|nr:Putative SWIB/MDM2 domain-containing protein [Septoria linicola]
MADSLPLEQRAAYSAIIDKVLANSDLNTISAKRIRKELQEQVGHDLSSQKQAITDLIMSRFDKAQEKQKATSGDIEPVPTANGHSKRNGSESNGYAESSLSPPASTNKRKADSEELSEVEDSPAPKKVKKEKKAETDEEMARRLAAELNATSARSTRGGGAKRKTPAAKTKKTKKKSSAKVNSDDDSAVESGDKPVKEKKGGFHKPMALSEPLAAMLGESQLSRPQTVKQIWAYVKSRDMQDPSDKRQILCDDKMRAVFKADKVHMFTMNKLLAAHLYPVDEVVVE